MTNTVTTLTAPAVLRTVLTVGQGPAGAPGNVTGADKFYKHTQGVPAAVWNVAHNLGKQPAVAAFDSTGAQIEGDVVYLSGNTLTIAFASPVSGEANLN